MGMLGKGEDPAIRILGNAGVMEWGLDLDQSEVSRSTCTDTDSSIDDSIVGLEK